MKSTFMSVVAVCALSLIGGCKSAPESSSEAENMRNEVRSMSRETLAKLEEVQPGARAKVEAAYGHAEFSNFGMKIIVVGSGSGEGVAVSKSPRTETFMRMAELQAGLGLGVKKFRLVWVFSNEKAFNDFVHQGWTFGGQATAEAQSGDQGGGMAGALAVAPGVYLYQITDTGLALELTVKGTKYYNDDELN